MNFDNPKGIIELGNINLKCLIFNVDNAENFEILSTSIIPTKGIHNGVVVNLAKASSSIRSCISEAERKARVSLKNINVATIVKQCGLRNISRNGLMDGALRWEKLKN